MTDQPAPFSFAAAKPKTKQEMDDRQQEMDEKQQEEAPKNGRRKRTTAAPTEPVKRRKTRQRKPDPLPAMIRFMNDLPARKRAKLLASLQEIFG